MTKILLILSSLYLVSCSTAQRPTQQGVISLSFSPELLQVVQSKSMRAPASLNEWMNQEEKSLKRVYFTLMYQQYLKMGDVVSAPSKIQSCPQFHHDKIQLDDEHRPFMMSKKLAQTHVLETHYQNMKKEMDVLCDEGRSANTYKFENLVTYHTSRPQFHREAKSMEAVLKIPVFANYYLLKMMTHPSEALVLTKEEKNLIEVSQTFWFKNYVSLAHNQAQDQLKIQVVKR